MVLFSTLTSKINRNLAPFLLKHGLSARFILAMGKIRDNPFLDACLLIPFTQKILQVEIQEMALEMRKQNQVEDPKLMKRTSVIDDWAEQMFDRFILPKLDQSHTDEDNSIRKNKEDDTKRLENEKRKTNPRLYAFESVLRPILVPKDEWADIERWRFHTRFCKWLRAEYLICKYSEDIRRALSVYTKLNVTPLLTKKKYPDILRYGLFQSILQYIGRNKEFENHSLPTYYAPLPSISTLENTFQMKDWLKAKATKSDDFVEMRRIATNMLNGTIREFGSNVQIPIIDPDTSVQKLNMEEILEVAGCQVSHFNAFNAICEECGIFEFWTEEYVSTLANYLLDRCSQYDGPTVIIDIGAGDGTLIHYLDRYIHEAMSGYGHNSGLISLKKSSPKSKHKVSQVKPTLIAVDDGSWSIQPKASVLKMDYKRALQRYQPYDDSGKKKHQLIIITSWMPMFVDWTQTYRDFGVDEYILIGQSDDGNCGDNWLTWGNNEYRDEDHPSVPPHVHDGFERIDLHEISKLQFSRFDTQKSNSSSTVSFRKVYS